MVEAQQQAIAGDAIARARGAGDGSGELDDPLVAAIDRPVRRERREAAAAFAGVGFTNAPTAQFTSTASINRLC